MRKLARKRRNFPQRSAERVVLNGPCTARETASRARETARSALIPLRLCRGDSSPIERRQGNRSVHERTIIKLKVVFTVLSLCLCLGF